MITHLEIHHLATARDAEYLSRAGYPRYDIEVTECASCNARVAEVNGQDGAVFWRPMAVVVWDNGLAAVCARCVKPVLKVVSVV